VDYSATTSDETTPAVEKKPKIEEPEIPCTLDERIQNLLKLICDINTMKQTCIELEYDTTRAPLGE
jgi:poly [ADP-ribose] polymerase